MPAAAEDVSVIRRRRGEQAETIRTIEGGTSGKNTKDDGTSDSQGQNCCETGQPRQAKSADGQSQAEGGRGAREGQCIREGWRKARRRQTSGEGGTDSGCIDVKPRSGHKVAECGCRRIAGKTLA